MIFIYITNPTKKVAKEITHHLLQKKLIACANIFPIESLYWWRGKIACEREHVIIAKTAKENFKRVQEAVTGMHPYEIPCIVKISVTANDPFSRWLRHEVTV